MVHRTTCRVIYGDTDRMGQAYYGNYFRWFEVGRTELFRAAGLSYKEIEERGFFLPDSDKLRLRHEEEMIHLELVVEGMAAIQSGENPRNMIDARRAAIVLS